MPVNTAALKSFAPVLRRQLLEAVGRKLDLLLNSQTPDTLSTYATQIAELRQREAENREQLLERVAYTWFNRLCALRYLDARGWHPFGCKVLMPAAEGETQPELLKLMRAGSLPAELKPHTNEVRLHGLLDGLIPPAIAGADPQGEVYRELVLASCRSYHQLLPELFEGLDDASELLLPDDLLSEGSIAGAFRTAISDDDCEDVEIIGWLYQFYIAERKKEVDARKEAVKSTDIPAVTQLFTPHWIVRYLVENSLGRLWMRSRPNSGLRAHMPYYIDDPDGQDPADSITVAGPEEIKVLDPACGSGHILTYAFDLLIKIWEEDGYLPSEIPGKILSHNLFGLEICHRAAQLAQLALVCKAREYARNAFRRLTGPRVICLHNVPITPEEVSAWTESTGTSLGHDELSQIHQFREHVHTYGSLIKPQLELQEILRLKSKICDNNPAGDLLVESIQDKLLLAICQAEALSRKYHIVVANPPYHGAKKMNPVLKDFTKRLYTKTKADLFSSFIERGFSFAMDRAWSAMITMDAWMFLPTYEQMRTDLLEKHSLFSMVHMPYEGKGGTPMGINFGTSATLWLNSKPEGKKANFQCIRYFECDDEFVPLKFPTHNERFRWQAPDFFKDVPGAPVVYWAGLLTLSCYKRMGRVSDFGDTCSGLQTSDNERFLRLWHEISEEKFKRNTCPSTEGREISAKWFPHKKGGPFRKWYGNNDFVINWESGGEELFEFARSLYGSPTRIIKNTHRYFQQGVTWSHSTSSRFSARLLEEDSIFNVESPALFEVDAEVMLPFLCSAVGIHIIELANPTLHFVSSSVGNLPFEQSLIPSRSDLSEIYRKAVSLAKEDWNNSETSWGFRDLPMLRSSAMGSDQGAIPLCCKGLTLIESWKKYADYCLEAIKCMQGLETDNNILWIDSFGLQEELESGAKEDEITLARPDRAKDVADFVSYAVGCMMGRFSLDQPGLILADSRDSQAAQLAAYEAKVGKPLSEVQFKPDPDGIIPVLDGEWFEDDIVARTREFLAVTFPESSVVDNLRFIEESLGKDIRKYFCSDFYKDHLQTYKKRPIYWMVQSPKKGFACLLYLHRFTKDTLNQVLNNYFRPYLQKLEARLAQLRLDQLNDDLPARERTSARKEAEKITKVLKECQAWEQDALLPLAQQRIELDLDDGVKVNYLKLQDVLAPIPGLAAKED
jgi:hypothetical protein